MKKNLIFAGLLAFAVNMHSQNPNTAWPTTNNNVGLGITNPAWKFDLRTSGGVDGLSLMTRNSGSPDASVIYMSADSAGGKLWSIAALGSGFVSSPDYLAGGLDIYCQTTGKTAIFCNGTTGLVGINNNRPISHLDVVGNGSNDLFTLRNMGAGTNALNVTAAGLVQVPAGNVEIGTTGQAAQLAVVNVGAGNSRAGLFRHLANSSLGLQVDGFGTTNTSGTAIGVRGNAQYAKTNYAGYFSSYGDVSGVTNYGVYGSVVSNLTSGSLNYAVYGTVSGNYGGGGGPNWAGYFDGDVFTTATSYYTSDKNLKKDISKIKNSLNIINRLNPVTYKFDYESNTSINLPDQNQYGFISQEIQEILPEFTKNVIHPAKLDENGKEISPAKEILGLNYQGFIALLTKGMQEQQVLIEEQNKKIASLQEQVDAITNTKTGNATGINQLNSATDGFALDQNIPNPFSNETVIGYKLTKETKSASLVVYDLSGKQLTSFPLEMNSNSITITSEKLAAGIYIYSVMADGKIMDSKRMVVAGK